MAKSNQVEKYIRATTIPVHIILNAMRSGVQNYHANQGISVSLCSARLHTYLKGVACVHCGIEGHYFAVECKPKGRWHLNIYHKNDMGIETMITSDHIIPKAKGGSNLAENRQPMCSRCNGLKAHHNSIEEAIAAKLTQEVGEASPEKMYEKMAALLRSSVYARSKMHKRDDDDFKKWHKIYHQSNKKFDRMQSHLESMELPSEILLKISSLCVERKKYHEKDSPIVCDSTPVDCVHI